MEDYFHVNAFADRIRTDEWGGYALRVGNSTRRILDLFDEHQVKATFFVLGWVAERCPDLVEEIHRRGHEVASHGYGHQLVWNLGPAKFREDLRRANTLLANLTGTSVVGFRAPTYSITDKTLWALDILIEEGFRYDSSIFPIRHDVYGMPDAERFPHDIRRMEGTIREFPLSTLRLGPGGRRFNFPVGGGGYLRFLPVQFIRWAIRQINFVESQPAVLYFHPWEIDPGQPRIRASLKSRFRHYCNLDTTLGKVRALISTLPFAPMSTVLGIRYAPSVTQIL